MIPVTPQVVDDITALVAPTRVRELKHPAVLKSPNHPSRTHTGA